MPGDTFKLHNADSAVVDSATEGDFQHPVEYLDSINGSGLTLAELQLKIGAPIMLLRNLDPSRHLCNNAHVILLKATFRVLEVCILGGGFHDQRAFTPLT